MSAIRLVDEAETKLREWLASSAFEPGMRLPSERALASRFGLRHYSVNRAMWRLIAAGQVERDGYKLLLVDKQSIAPAFGCHLIVSKNSIHIPGYLRVAKKMDVALTLHPWLTIDDSLHILDTLDVGETEGVVFDPTHVLSHPIWEKTAERLGRRGIPVICLGQPVAGRFSVLPDHAQSLQLAVSHLLELGHREIGFVTAPPSCPATAEVFQAWIDLCRKHELRGSEARVHFQAALRFKDDAVETARLVARDWRDATALVVSASLDPCNLPLLQDQLVRQGVRVPRDLSLVLSGHARTTNSAAPAVSSTGFDVALMQELAFHLARRAIREKQPSGLLPAASCLRLQCELSLRGTTQPPSAQGSPAKMPDRGFPVPPAPARPAAVAPDAMRRIEASLRNAYPLAARASLSERPRFSPVDLSPYVNRPLNFRRGWLGDLPLKQFPPGRREIHGVPFDIIGGLRRGKCGAIVFRSASNNVGNARKLPGRLVIPIGCKVRAVYVLHGCGYAKFLQPFARYSFHGPKSRLADIPLVSLGQPPAGFSLESLPPGSAMPNIQDWWTDYPHMDFPSAHMALVRETNASGIPHNVCLYTLEWLNPSPEIPVTQLEVTADSDLATSLGILAVTVLKP